MQGAAGRLLATRAIVARLPPTTRLLGLTPTIDPSGSGGGATLRFGAAISDPYLSFASPLREEGFALDELCGLVAQRAAGEVGGVVLLEPLQGVDLGVDLTGQALGRLWWDIPDVDRAGAALAAVQQAGLGKSTTSLPLRVMSTYVGLA